MTRILTILFLVVLLILSVLPVAAQRENTVYQSIWAGLTGAQIDALASDASGPFRNIGQDSHLVTIRCVDNGLDICADLGTGTGASSLWIEGSHDNTNWTRISRPLVPKGSGVTGAWAQNAIYRIIGKGAFPYVRLRAIGPQLHPGAMTTGPLFTTVYSGTIGTSFEVPATTPGDVSWRSDGIKTTAFSITAAGDNVIDVDGAVSLILSAPVSIVKVVLWNSGGNNTILLKMCGGATEFLRLENMPQFTGVVLPGSVETPAFWAGNTGLCINLSAATRVTGYVQYTLE